MGYVLPSLSLYDIFNYLTDEIKKKFQFFPRLHCLCSARPNAIPPAVQTGVGPEGVKRYYLQPPSSPVENAADSYPIGKVGDLNASLPVEVIDPQLCNLSSGSQTPLVSNRNANTHAALLPPYPNASRSSSPVLSLPDASDGATQPDVESWPATPQPSQSTSSSMLTQDCDKENDGPKSSLQSAVENTCKMVTKKSNKRTFEDAFVEHQEC